MSKVGKSSQQPLTTESLSYRLHFLKADVIWKLEQTFSFRDAWSGFLLFSHQGSVEKHQDTAVRLQGDLPSNHVGAWPQPTAMASAEHSLGAPRACVWGAVRGLGDQSSRQDQTLDWCGLTCPPPRVRV